MWIDSLLLFALLAQTPSAPAPISGVVVDGSGEPAVILLELEPMTGPGLPVQWVELYSMETLSLVRTVLGRDVVSASDRRPSIELAVPPGEYVLWARYRVQGPCTWSPTRPPPSSLVRGRYAIDATSGTHTVLQLPGPRGGAIEVRFDLPDPERFAREQARLRASERSLDPERRAGIVARDTGRRLPWEHAPRLRFWDPVFGRVFDPSPGETALVWERFAPGEHVLTFTAEGYASVERSVLVVEGERVLVDVRLEREATPGEEAGHPSSSGG